MGDILAAIFFVILIVAIIIFIKGVRAIKLYESYNEYRDCHSLEQFENYSDFRAYWNACNTMKHMANISSDIGSVRGTSFLKRFPHIDDKVILNHFVKRKLYNGNPYMK